MTFKRVFRGYDPEEVEKYINSLKNDEQVLANQKDRIDELAEENVTLRSQLETYKKNERAITQALVESQKLAEELKGDAEKFSELVLKRAKIFYATWQAYSQTLISALSNEEVLQFNKLKRKIEVAINAYDGAKVRDFADDVIALAQNQQPAAQPVENAAPAPVEKVETSPAEKDGELVNPIAKVERESGHVIELSELLVPTESLEDLCRDLGLNTKK